MTRVPELRVLSVATAALFSTLTGCGKLPQTDSAKLQDSPDAPTASTYATWCTAWGLSCPPTVIGDDVKGHVTPVQWLSSLKIAEGFGQSATVIDLTATDLNDPVFNKAAQALGFETTWTALQTRLTTANFGSLHVAAGSAVVNLSAPATLTGPSGLIQHLGPLLTLAVTPGQQLGVTGLVLAGSTAGSDTPHTLDVTNTGTFTWVGDTNAVSGVPANFLLTETLGAALPALGAKPAYKDVEALVAPFAAWFSSREGLSINVGAAPLQVLAAEVPTFVTDPEKAAVATAVLQKLSSLLSTPASRAQSLFEATTTAGGVTCVINGQAQLQLAEHVAITAVKTLDNGNTSITFDGIKVVLGTGILTVPVDLKRIDLTPTSIIIQDLPLIGSYTVNIDAAPTDATPEASKLSFTCS